MKIINVRESRDGEGFNVIIKFEVDSFAGDRKEIESIGYWISHNTTNNFILKEFSCKIIAGGCVDNATAWDEKWHKDDDYSVNSLDFYELKMYEGDATMFLLKYNGGENGKDGY